MAITTLDQAAAGAKAPGYFAKALTGALVAGRPFSPLYLAGMPAAAAAPAPGVAGAALTSFPGQIPIPSASGNTHLHRFSGVSSAQAGLLLLCDRLWHNSGLAVTTASTQSVNSPTWPARDALGGTNGEQVFIGIEMVTNAGAGAAVPVLQYTNSAGTTARTTGLLDSYAASAAGGMFFRFPLANGDAGVRAVENITLQASMTSGSISLVAYRVLATLELTAAGVPNAVDFLTSGSPRCYDGTVPFLLFIPQTTTTTQLTGSVVFTQG